ncbi:MAG: hypothetical protein IKZ57_02855 [Spirochaetia bacterium]|nr:hypothetical protein [Spirochaetia bacterium]
MTKKELLKQLKGDITEVEKMVYLKRLIKPYQKYGKSKLFILQYLNGSGSELENKFWSKCSSSRVAFDIYSCLADDKGIDDFEFEYHLPRIIYKNKETGHPPNMDIFYRIGDTIYFIESKFTETPQKILKLPEAYYITNNEYKNSDGKKVTYPIKERFHKREDIADKFSSFCQTYVNMKDKIKKDDWFDYKQEICHLFGIIFYALERTDCNVKRIDFKNIVYKFDDYEKLGNDYISAIAKEFIKDAKDMVNDILKISNKKIDFDYSISFTQDVYEKYKNKTAYGLDITIKELMAQNWSELDLS